jgi:hypothetical protein
VAETSLTVIPKICRNQTTMEFQIKNAVPFILYRLLCPDAVDTLTFRKKKRLPPNFITIRHLYDRLKAVI